MFRLCDVSSLSLKEKTLKNRCVLSGRDLIVGCLSADGVIRHILLAAIAKMPLYNRINIQSKGLCLCKTQDMIGALEEWIMISGKPKKIMHDNGKQFTSKIFKRFLEHNNIKDKPIPNSYPQLQGKVEAYNKIVKNEFLAVEDISSRDDGKVRYDMFGV
jgi:transposase InsO family protein